MVNAKGNRMTVSMTGFAARRGAGAGATWVWEIRGVNGKGMDLRYKVPEWIDGLEAGIRAQVQAAMTRGNIMLTLKVVRAAEGEGAVRLNAVALGSVLQALHDVEQAAMAAGVTLAQANPADVLAVRGVLEAGVGDAETAALCAALLADLPHLIADFQAMRGSEGVAIAGIIGGQLDVISDLLVKVKAAAAGRESQIAPQMREVLQRLLAEVPLDETRLAQELAILAVKQDVAEELDRLKAHVKAARALLTEPAAVGRKLDFLVQEFMREANTLCAKAANIHLTRIGLDLKTVIDQMREQIQNVE
jgi:uncharacterized protein (TIGR00255 family)